MSDYTSNLLCHFVGRSKVNDDERFELLITIIKGRKLIANLSNPNNPESLFPNGYQCEHVGEVFEKCDCVCFCDIPNEALAIHTNKYSKFGLGFEKTFIAKQGAHPVMYVPENYDIMERGDDSNKGKTCTPRDPKKYYPFLLKLTTYLLPLMEIGYIGTNQNQTMRMIKQFGLYDHLNLFDNDIQKMFLSQQYHSLVFSLMMGITNQMAYVKLFDATLPDDHPDNYYMEREWRSLNNIDFSINDIKTIYLPTESYKYRFMEEFPEYNGNFFIFEGNA